MSYFFKGQGHIDESLYDNVKSIIKELISNTLKHSNASQIFLSVKTEKFTEIMYMDNGMGKDELNKGNGMSGMEHRVKAFAGKITFQLSSYDGFNCKIVI